MKTKMKKILFIVILVLGSQVVQAESYQRWIYWVNRTHHQVTAEEMAEITEKLYDYKILANKTFTLSTGVSLKIPKPTLFLKYIERSVKGAKSSADTRQEVIDEIRGAEKMRWGTDVSVLVKNYWNSTKQNKVVYTDNYSGEGKDTDFLFINGIPFLKCDCGNPLEPINLPVPKDPILDERREQGEPKRKDFIRKEEKDPGFPKDLGLAVQSFPKSEPQGSLLIPDEKITWWRGLKPWQQTSIIAVGTTLLTVGTYEVVKNWDDWFKNESDVPFDPQDGQPVGGGKKKFVVPSTPSFPTKYQVGVSVGIFR